MNLTNQIESLRKYKIKVRPLYSGICLQCKKIFYSLHNKTRTCSRKCCDNYFIEEKNPNWTNGGIGKSGYKIIRKNRKYWLEHRYIMTNYLGRPLKTNEQIHHKNGIRHDNRLGNLELWIKPSQPNGQKFSDILKFLCDNYRKEVIYYLKTKKIK